MGKKFFEYRKNHVVLWICAIILFYVLNAISPFLRDDFTYQFLYKSPGYTFDYSHHINTFSDIINSQYLHYLHWGGRAIVHILTQLFCGILGKHLYNVIAALMFGFWMLPFGKLCMPTCPQKVVLPSAMFFTFLFWLYMGEPLVFYSGITFSLNYLYTSFLCLWFIYLYLSYNKYKSHKLLTFIMPVLAFFSAWGHEAFTIGTGILLFVWSLKNIKTIEKKQIFSLILFGLGSVFLILAPGNFARNANNQSDVFGVLRQLFVSYKFGICLLLLFGAYRKNIAELFVLLKQNIHFVSAWLVSILFVMAIGQTSVRALVGVDLFGFILFVRLVSKRISNYFCEQLFPILSLSLLGLLVCIIFYQRHASMEYTRLYETCKAAPKGSTQYLTFAYLQTPKWMQDKFVSYRYYWCSEFWDKEYAKAYGINLHISEEEALLFKKAGMKIKGNNPFYQIGDYLYSSTNISSNLRVKIHYSNYKADNMLLLCKKALSYIFPNLRSKTLELTYKVQKVDLNPNLSVYRVFIGNDNTGRQIDSIDII